MSATEAWLKAFLLRHEAVAGTVHVTLPGDRDTLALRAAVGIPPKVQEITARVPRGKGMAGLALERGQAVSTCNLQTDSTGDVRPGAKAVQAQAAVALPVEREGAVAVVGLAWMDDRELPESLLEQLTEDAGSVEL
ncbi:MAG: GAF domain-containing protein [Nannocystales bacterium]